MGEAREREVMLPLSAIDEADETFCFRMNVYVNDLVTSIEKHGQDFPVVVRPRGDGYQLVCGFRRVAALRRLRREEVRAVVRELGDEEAYRLAWSENVARRSYSVVDRAHGVAKARLTGRRMEEIERLFGLKRSALLELRSLAEAPVAVQAAVEAGEIKPKHAVAMNVLKRRYTDFDYDRWLAEVVAEGLSVRALKLRASIAYDEPRQPLVKAGLQGRFRLRARVVVPREMSPAERASVRSELMLLVDALDAEEE